jgi:predicted metal-dependent hydrolase
VRDDPLAVANLAISRMRAKEEHRELQTMARQYLTVTQRPADDGEADDELITEILLNFSKLKSMF